MPDQPFPGLGGRQRSSSILSRISRGEQGEFLESMALLTGAGIDSASALDSLATSARSKNLRKHLSEAVRTVNGGYPLWYALQAHNILPPQRVWLVRIGEESGRLAEHVQAAVVQHRKESLFRARVQSAMLYPAIITLVAIVAGVSVAWFILPRLATVFATLQVDLPFLTRVLLALGRFLGAYGIIAVPVALAVIITVFFVVFVVPGTRRIGEFILLHTPGVSGLIRDGELARFGHVFGSLMSVGVPVPEALGAVASASGTASFRRFYERLRERILNGQSFAQSFAEDKVLSHTLPRTIQQLLVTSEQSGQMAATATRLGEIYEGRLDLATKNLTVVLEPILLFAVWIGVVLLAVSIITPIYSVLQGVSR